MGTDTSLCFPTNRSCYITTSSNSLQVTNPPLDGIREEIVTDTSLSIGSDYNLFSIESIHAKKLRIQNPIISNEDLDKIKFIKHQDFQAASVSVLYDVKGHNGLQHAIENVVSQVKDKVIQGANVIILSDRGVNRDQAPIRCYWLALQSITD